MLSHLAVSILGAMQAAAPPAKTVFIPTSQVIDIARSVARSEGYSLAHRNNYFFDLMSNKDGKPIYPGYITVIRKMQFLSTRRPGKFLISVCASTSSTPRFSAWDGRYGTQRMPHHSPFQTY